MSLQGRAALFCGPSVWGMGARASYIHLGLGSMSRPDACSPEDRHDFTAGLSYLLKAAPNVRLLPQGAFTMLPTLASTSKANLPLPPPTRGFLVVLSGMRHVHRALSLCSCHSSHPGHCLSSKPRQTLLPSLGRLASEVPPLATVCQDICPHPSPPPDPRLLGESRAIVSVHLIPPQHLTQVLSVCWDNECQDVDGVGLGTPTAGARTDPPVPRDAHRQLQWGGG